MSIDTFTTAALVDEFNAKLAGGRVQDTVELDRQTFGLEVYANRQRHYLLLSGDNQNPRALIVPEKLRRGVQTASPLGLLFRRRIEGMRINVVRQPPWERIIIFELVAEDQALQIIVELIARRANLLLVEDGTILDCARRIGPQDNRVRIILPRHNYVPPPLQTDKVAPDTLTPQAVDRLLRRSPDDKAWSVLVKGVLGFSPLIAREAVYRAYQRTDIKASQANPYNLHAALESFVHRILRHEWKPGVVYDENDLPSGLSALPITYTGRWEPKETASEALNSFFGEIEGPAAYEAARKPIRAQLEKARQRVQRKLNALERELVDQAEIETLRQSGELVLAYQYTIDDGQDALVAQYDPEGEPFTIKLDTSLTPLENAQRYFERYEKKKRARDQLPERIQATQQELDFLDQLDIDLEMAENWQDIGEVQDTLQKNGFWQGKRYAQPKGGKSAPRKITTDEGFIIWVGRNARQNAQLLDRCEPYDLWLHARGVPGSHVIIKTNAKEVPAAVLEHAASLAAYYSKLRQDTKVQVQIAECRHVRKMKGGKLGQVTIHKERDGLLVSPAPLEDEE
ncbi:MAG: fibronectin/fibrinogen-binding protein [Chloroflexi bacterium]|nr:fibronectin/fibrinogen-binding protein [Chloroflexota bacterium]